MTQVLFKSLVVLGSLLAGVSPLAQTDQASKTSGIGSTRTSGVNQFNGKASLFAKNLDIEAPYELSGDDRVPTASTIRLRQYY
jgi:hypothetical protein